jgi:hypothetical protein
MIDTLAEPLNVNPSVRFNFNKSGVCNDKPIKARAVAETDQLNKSIINYYLMLVTT